MLTYYIATLSLVPYFTSRAFIPLATTAIVARLGPQWSWLADLPGVHLLAGLPPWATSDAALLILCGFGLAELIMTKNPELREFLMLTLTDAKLKAVGAFLLSFGMVQGDWMELVQHVQQNGLSTDFEWGKSLAYTWSFGIGIAVWTSSVLRSGIYTTLSELDEDDDLGLQGFLSWAEDIFSFLGVLFVIILPAIALMVAGLTLVGLYVIRRYLEHLDEKTKIPCEHCGNVGYPCGLRCASCGQLRREVREVNWLGSVKATVARDLESHRLELIARKRCPSCGDRYRERRLEQECRSCRTQPFGNNADLDTYLGRLQAKLPRTLAVLLLLSCVPIFGLIPGVIYYRLSLVSSLRCYLPRSVGFFMRWIVRIINFVLICLQPIPLLGSLTLPLMCLANYTVYRAALTRQGQRAFALNPRTI